MLGLAVIYVAVSLPFRLAFDVGGSVYEIGLDVALDVFFIMVVYGGRDGGKDGVVIRVCCMWSFLTITTLFIPFFLITI